VAKSLKPNYATKFTISNDSGVIAGCLNSLPLEQSLLSIIGIRPIRKSAENSGSEASASASASVLPYFSDKRILKQDCDHKTGRHAPVRTGKKPSQYPALSSPKASRRPS
jgi:hypothetical protein